MARLVPGPLTGEPQEIRSAIRIEPFAFMLYFVQAPSLNSLPAVLIVSELGKWLTKSVTERLKLVMERLSMWTKA
jgi:hypothetical protein